jgi:carbon storage regulator
MLVLSRRTDEKIKIGDDITITIVRFHPFKNEVSLGIEAPQHIPVWPDELDKSSFENLFKNS